MGERGRNQRIDLGLLVMRLGLAVPMLIYAVPKLIAGASAWQRAVRDIPLLGQSGSPEWVGLAVLILVTLAALMLLTGFLFRLATLVLTLFFVVFLIHFMSLGYRTLPIYAASQVGLCLGLMFSGPGRFSIAVKIESK